MKFRKSLILLLCAAFLVSASITYAEVVDKVLVVVNDEVVTQREFNRMFIPIKKNFETRFQGEDLKVRLEQVRADLLKQLVDAKLTVSLAKMENIEIDEEELQNRINKVKSYYPSEGAFLQEIPGKIASPGHAGSG